MNAPNECEYYELDDYGEVYVEQGPSRTRPLVIFRYLDRDNEVNLVSMRLDQFNRQRRS